MHYSITQYKGTIMQLVKIKSIFLLMLFVVLTIHSVPTYAQSEIKKRTHSGTTFSLPSSWSATINDKITILQSPDPDLKLALIDVGAKNASTALARAWSIFKPDFHRPLRISLPEAAKNGWEKSHSFHYDVPPNEKQVIWASAKFAGNAWLVVIEEASQASAEKRSGQLRLILESLRPNGYQRESFFGKTAHSIDASFIASMKEFLTNGMRQLQIPGVAFSLIDQGKIAYEGGLGVRELGKPDPIDAHTLFLAASNTKALTTLLLAELVDENKIRWDEPVIDVYPSFKIGDEKTTKTLQIKHLVCACTGMPRQDLEWVFGSRNQTPKHMLEILSGMQPTSQFGDIFQYSNLLAASAGFIAGNMVHPNEELGIAYDQAMQQKVFNPLNMKESTFNFTKAMSGHYAKPHDVNIDGNPVVGQMDLNYNVIPLRPSGGLWTNIHDLSQYVMMELAKGQLSNGQRLVSEKNLMQRRVPNVTIGEDVHYGMGLMIDKSLGITIIHHGGDLAGYHSDMIWLPEYNIGAVIFTNSENGNVLRDIFLRKLVELIFDGKPEADAQLISESKRIDIERIKNRSTLHIPPDPSKSRMLAPYYYNEILGSIWVYPEGNDLIFRTAPWQSKIASRKNDDGTTSFISISPNLQSFEFVSGERNQAPTLVIRDAQHEYEFSTREFREH